MSKMSKTSSTPKKLTVLDGWSIGSDGMIGVTVFVVSGSISAMAGPAACLSYLIAAAVTILVAITICEVTAAYPESGGAYIYPKKIIGSRMGDFLSYLSGLAMYCGQGLLGPATLGLALANYTIAFVELLGVDFPISNKAFAIIAVLFFGISNMISTKIGAAIQVGSTVLVVGPIIIFLVWGGANVDTSLLVPFMPNGISSVIAGAATAWLGYGAWSAIPNMASEFKNPAKDVPRSMILSLVTCGLLFGGIVLVMNGLLPYSVLGDLDAPVADAFATVHVVGGLIIAFGGVFAAVSTLNGLMMAGSRMTYTMGVQGGLPKIFAKTNKEGVPVVALAVSTAIMVLLSGSATLTFLVQCNVFVTAFSWLISMICQIVLRTKHKEIVSPMRCPLFPVIPVVAIVLSLYMLSKLNVNNLLTGGLILGFAALLFVIFNFTPAKKLCFQAEAQTVTEDNTSE